VPDLNVNDEAHVTAQLNQGYLYSQALGLPGQHQLNMTTHGVIGIVRVLLWVLFAQYLRLLYARLGVISPRHRGKRLGHTFALLTEAIGRAIGMGMIYGLATLKVPHVQRVFEALGWQLIGITPGYDREMVAPGVVKRVYEAIYAKVLVADARLLRPSARNLTERTRAFFRLLFPRKRLQRA
jgi:hypothetical protein